MNPIEEVKRRLKSGELTEAEVLKVIERREKAEADALEELGITEDEGRQLLDRPTRDQILAQVPRARGNRRRSAERQALLDQIRR